MKPDAMLERILILGGTALARQLADALVSRGRTVITSLAGVTRQPHVPRGEVRIGGFGGAEGLAGYLVQHHISQIVDATHPFAAQMSANAALAARDTRLPLLRLEPPAWAAETGDAWILVADMGDAIAALPPECRAAVTVGRKEIGGFFARGDLSGLARMIEQPDCVVPPQWQLLLERPPFTLGAEVDLLRAERIQVLVSKNAGGPRAAKLDAARALGLPVVMVQRPEKPRVQTIATVELMLSRLGLTPR